MRPLVEAGRLYRAVTPLYIIEHRKKRTYLYSDKEYEEYDLKPNDTVIRAKGLGEINADVLKEICFDRQRYKRITVSDSQKAKELLDVLEGKEVKPRKEFIFNNARELGFNY